MSNVARIMHAWCFFAPCRLSFDTRNYAMHRFSTGTTLYNLFILLLTINTRVSSITEHITFFFLSNKFELCNLFTLRVSVYCILVHAREFGLARRSRQSRPASAFFVPSEIGSTRVRAIRSRAARPYSRARLRIWSRETVSAVPSRVSFFLYRPRSDRHGYERSDPWPHDFILVHAWEYGLARRFQQSRPALAFFCTVRDRIETGNSIHRTSDQIPGPTATVPMQQFGSKNTRDAPSARRQNTKYLIELGNGKYSSSMPVVKLLPIATSNARAPWPVRVYKALSLAQAATLDPIQMDYRTIRLVVRIV